MFINHFFNTIFNMLVTLLVLSIIYKISDGDLLIDTYIILCTIIYSMLTLTDIQWKKQ